MPASVSHRTSSESNDSSRKRVGKACDRCRLKKSKCDGSSPCTRCRADNAICVFGERKKTHDKAYPKGYVEMLEQQQSQLVAGLQETYRRMLAANIWPGKPLAESNGNPLTHDILDKLDILELKNDGSGEHEPFEDDCRMLQQRLISEGAALVGRRGSISSESGRSDSHKHARTFSHSSSHGTPASEQSHPHKHARTSSQSSVHDTSVSDKNYSRKHARASSRSSFHHTPVPTHAAPVFDENFSFQAASPSSISQSPAPQIAKLVSPIVPSPLHHEAISNDTFLTSSWQEQIGFTSAHAMRSEFVTQAPRIHDGFQAALANYDNPLDFDNMMSFGSLQYPNPAREFESYSTQDWTNEQMDVDFGRFVQVST